MTKLWLVKRTSPYGYDDYDSMVVAADTELEARTYHPDGCVKAQKKDDSWEYIWLGGTHSWKPDWQPSWCSIEDTSASYLGTTDRDLKGVVLASFNAG